jgi:tetratricopeptide (TPR) repeat protein
VRLTRDLSALGFESDQLARTSARLSAEQFGTSDGPDAWFQAKLLALAGDCAAAVEMADRAANQQFFAAVWDVALDGDLLAAECLLQQGDRRRARERIQRSLQHRPGTLSGLAAAAAADRALGIVDGSAAQQLRALHDPLSSGYALSQAFLAWGNPALALEEADRVLAALPEAGVVRYARARALLALGRKDEALDDYARALAAFPAHGYETRPFDAALAERRAARPSDPAVLALVAEHERRAGRIAQAREAAQAAVAAYGPLAPQSLRATLRWLMVAEPGASRN